MVLWLTIDIDGLSMVLGKVKAGSQKRPKNKKKTWLVQQIPRGKQSLDALFLAQCYKETSERTPLTSDWR